jgi:hypothetical protein
MALQLFVEIVCEAAHFLKLAFTKHKLYIHRSEERWARYLELIKLDPRSDDESKWIERRQEKTWTTFDKPIGEPDWSWLSSDLFEGLDNLNNQWLKDDGLFIFDDDNNKSKATEYWKQVQDLFKRHVPDSSEMDIIHKIRWYRREAIFQDRLVIPMLTPKLLDALQANVKARAKAYEEVSDKSNLFLSLDFPKPPPPSNNI